MPQRGGVETDVPKFQPLPSADRPAPQGWHPRASGGRDAFWVPWRWWEALVVFALSFIAQNVAVAVVALALPVALLSAASIALAIPLSLAVTVAWLATRYRGAFRRVLGPVRWRPSDVLVGVGHGLGAYIVLNLLAFTLLNLLAQRSGFEIPEVQQGLQAAIRDSPFATAVILSAVLLAPIGEELLYRGVLFQALRARSALWVAILVSGVAFGLAHLQPLVIAITGVFGLYLAWVFHRRGSLLVPIAAHAVFNTMSVVLLLVRPEMVAS